jgi:hypothetical protein
MKAIITYKYKSRGVCGATVGADGTGDYAIVIEGEPEKVYSKIKECYATLRMPGHSNIVLVTDEEQFLGSPITEYKV